MPDQPYSSVPETLEHRQQVQKAIGMIVSEIIIRGYDHDQSKTRTPEVEVFDRVTPLLKTLTYGTPEYAASLKDMGPALDHHYANNSHHPEHFGEAGMKGMDIYDLIEMFCDWMAASQRTQDGSPVKSVDLGIKRFGIGEPLASILMNTAKEWHVKPDASDED